MGRKLMTTRVLGTEPAYAEVMNFKPARGRFLMPLDLLLQAKQHERIWNVVMGSIAGVSLLVGGIGIMNIMPAASRNARAR